MTTPPPNWPRHDDTNGPTQRITQGELRPGAVPSPQGPPAGPPSVPGRPTTAHQGPAPAPSAATGPAGTPNAWNPIGGPALAPGGQWVPLSEQPAMPAAVTPQRKRRRRAIIAAVAVLIVAVGGTVAVRSVYQHYFPPFDPSTATAPSNSNSNPLAGFNFHVVPAEIMPTTAEMSTILGAPFHGPETKYRITKLGPGKATEYPELCDLFIDPSTVETWGKALSSARQLLVDGPGPEVVDGPSIWSAVAVFRTAEDAAASLRKITGLTSTCATGFYTGATTSDGQTLHYTLSGVKFGSNSLSWNWAATNGAWIVNGVEYQPKCSVTYRVVDNLVVTAAKCGIVWSDDAEKVADWLIKTANAKNKK